MGYSKGECQQLATCSVCRKVYGLNTDGTVRAHGGCDGAGRQPAAERSFTVANMTEVTREAALFCSQCQRYRRFRYVERRVLSEPAARTRPWARAPGRVIGQFYACATCGHEQQWGCEG